MRNVAGRLGVAGPRIAQAHRVDIDPDGEVRRLDPAAEVGDVKVARVPDRRRMYWPVS